MRTNSRHVFYQEPKSNHRRLAQSRTCRAKPHPFGLSGAQPSRRPASLRGPRLFDCAADAATLRANGNGNNSKVRKYTNVMCFDLYGRLPDLIQLPLCVAQRSFGGRGRLLYFQYSGDGFAVLIDERQDGLALPSDTEFGAGPPILVQQHQRWFTRGRHS
jgi:hypothetical protein